MPSPYPKKVRWILYGLVLLTAILLVVGIEWWIARPVRTPAAFPTIDEPEVVEEKKRFGPIKLAVGPLGLLAPGSEAAAGDLLVAELSADRNFQLVERREIKKILGEIKLGEAGAIQPQDAIRIGHLLGADWFLFGSSYKTSTQTSSVVRIVDAERGAIRDLLVLPAASHPPVKAVEALTRFLRRTKSGSTNAGDAPVFLAIGGFADQSVRPRHAGVEAELRNYLTASLASERMILLERELSSLLLDEVRLQQRNSIASSNIPPRIQTTFWLVDGFWQSFDSLGDEIDLTVRVTRTGGSVGRQSVRALRGPALNEEAEKAVRKLIRTAPAPEYKVTRRLESYTQIARGMERSGLSLNSLYPFSLKNDIWRDLQEGQMPGSPRRENLLGSIQAFESALLLDPGNHEVQLFLARCLMDPAIGRGEEARDICRELTVDRSSRISDPARSILGISYLMEGDTLRAAELFRSFLEQDPSGPNHEIWRYLLDEAESELPNKTRLADADVRKRREEALQQKVDKYAKAARAGRRVGSQGEFNGFLSGPGGLEEGQAHLLEFLPKLIARAPEIEPLLVARSVKVLLPSVTNHPLMARFETTLATATRAPDKFPLPEFFEELDGLLFSAMKARLDPLAGRIAEAIIAAKKVGLVDDWTPDRQAVLGFALINLERWREAIEQFQIITNGVVEMSGSGPWGEYPAYVAPANLIDYCRQKLGETNSPNPLSFEMGKPFINLSASLFFIPDGRRVWVASGNMLLDQPVGGGPAVTNLLAVDPAQKPRAMAQLGNNLWIGTEGAGLIHFNKSTGKTRQYTSREGLLFDEICALHLVENRLYLGYGYKWSSISYRPQNWGGLSVLDLATDKIQTFTAPLPKDDAASEIRTLTGPPRKAVGAIAHSSSEDIWLSVAETGIHQFNRTSGTWSRKESPGFERSYAMAGSSDWVVAGNDLSPSANKNLDVLAIFKTGVEKPYLFGPKDGLPLAKVTCLALDGDQLWVGGPSYLVILDLRTRKIIRHCLMHNAHVLLLSLDGDHVWARIGGAIYRYPRALGQEAVSTKN